MSLLGMAGCNSSVDPVGGPGADVRGDEDRTPQDEEATFTTSLTDELIQVPAGSQKELMVEIERGENFEQTVKAEVNAPAQVIVADPASIEYQAGQSQGKLFLKAQRNAPLNQEFAVEILFQPESGPSLRKQLKVMVVEPERDVISEEQRTAKDPGDSN
jgi:hypothetical protein